MIYNDSLFAKVQEIYERRRIEAADRTYSLNQKLNADKDFAKNRDELSRANFMRQKYEFAGDAEQAEKFAEEYSRLKKQRAALLTKFGVTEKDLISGHFCYKCGDTGFLPHGGNCECFYRTLKTVIDDALGIPARKFATFDQYVSDTEQDEKIKSKLISYCEKFPAFSKRRNLIITGSTGSGKTFAAECISDAITEKKHSVIFLTAIKANDLFLRYHTSGDADKAAVYNLLTGCDLLVIDDLGTEPILNNVTVEYLTSFLSERLTNEKPFVITTNFNPDELKQRYTERLVSRLSTDQTAFLPFVGKDKRRSNK